MIMGMLSRVVGAMLLMGLCSGCAMHWGRADHDATIRSPKDAYVVIGVQPEKASVSLFEGSLSGGSFQQNRLPPASFVGFPEDGFVVTRVSADTAYAITFVTLYETGNELLLPPLVPCRGAKTIAFSVPGGQVLYVGHVLYRKIGGGAVPEFGTNFEEAKRFLAARYPNLAPKVTDAGLKLSTVSGVQCVGD